MNQEEGIHVIYFIGDRSMTLSCEIVWILKWQKQQLKGSEDVVQVVQ